MELATGYPGYDGRMPFENGMLPEMLRPHSDNSFCLGKRHLSPSEDNTAAGPFHRWSVGWGFERFYGSAAPTAHPHPYPRFVVAVPTATRAVPICVAGATRLLEETPAT
jgi:arylsulfatase A-like enzyme